MKLKCVFCDMEANYLWDGTSICEKCLLKKDHHLVTESFIKNKEKAKAEGCCKNG